MSDSDRNDKLLQFTAITGAAEDRAKFFLDSAAWQVDVALASYYENSDDGQVELNESTEAGSMETEDIPPQSNDSESPAASSRPKTRSKKTNSKFRTLNSLAKEEDDEEEGQAFYAGGSEHSGQQVLGPGKRRDIVADMFKSVQEHGVEVVDQRPSTSSSRAFFGTGYKLGETSTDSVAVPGVAQPPQPNEVTLKLWKEGFSINDGELRPYSDPRNKSFLDSIKKGEIPMEFKSKSGGEVHLAMEDHRMETFKVPGKKHKVFTGTGYTLGNPAPPVVGACREEDKPVNEQVAKENLQLDTSQPVTSIQIRLADGSRLVAQFNHTHTVGEIRSYILAARPQYATQSFDLLSSYPSKVLEDSQTIKEAGIVNSAIMQKMV
ncbi:NSFL1 cofactor p47-like [Coccinella septempunctata]|uniref:NSFL1 cofactor p47-like n=1 Tax=Coccinella septempunctata TaxID=41139 RepID=UPI001D06C5F4|nr:NSFL1 cofactor p47-like [Coccinella septempunctata]